MIDKITFILVMMVSSAQFIEGTPTVGAISASHQLKKRQTTVVENNIAIDDGNGVDSDDGNAIINAPLAVATANSSSNADVVTLTNAPAVGDAAAVDIVGDAVANALAVPPLEPSLFLTNVASLLKPGGLSDLDFLSLVFATTPPSISVSALAFLAPPDEEPKPVDLTAIPSSLPPGNAIVVVLGPLLDINSSPVQAILQIYISLPILIIVPDKYNLIEIADNIWSVANTLAPIFQQLPAQNITLIGVEVGAALLGATMQLAFPTQASFQSIIVVNPLVPVPFDVTFFVNALQVNTNPVMAINTIGGAIKFCSVLVNLDLAIFTNAVKIYVDPLDLLSYCTYASINIGICLLAFGAKVALDVMSGIAVVVPLGENAIFPAYANVAASDGQGLTASIIKPISAFKPLVYYYMPVDPIRNGLTLSGINVQGITGLDTVIAGVPSSPLTAIDILVTTYVAVFSNVFATRFISIPFDGTDYTATIVVGGKQLIVDPSITLDLFITALTQALVAVVGNFNPLMITAMGNYVFNTYMPSGLDPSTPGIPPSNPGNYLGTLSSSSSTSSSSSSSGSDSLLGTVGNIVDEVGNTVSNLDLPVVGDVAGPLVSEVGGLVENLDDSLGGLLGSVASPSSPSAASSSTSLLGSVTDTVGGLKNGLDLGGITDTVGGLTNGLDLGGITDTVGGLANGLDLGSITHTVGDVTNGLGLGGVGDTVSDLTGALGL